ncbi:hypothetical protein Q428_04310 [Fervidicella metallireducens AeB]|uniref:Uncharacterized protein n=1 Tax=Fervidicella metallireducens AeB TaxID=1403537 RepID=A0A017RWQ5_9CLOT|nr:hypothetical protein [Fervidicella metallireducens]EYE89087.1 hypothetical protein Q428_04310 [Fervidicella metallireducens AeB]
MARIGIDNTLKDVISTLKNNKLEFVQLPHDRIGSIPLDEFDIVVVREQSDVSSNSKDQTIIECNGISPSEVYEKLKYMN